MQHSGSKRRKRRLGPNRRVDIEADPQLDVYRGSFLELADLLRA
jgi:hypothetical protein